MMSFIVSFLLILQIIICNSRQLNVIQNEKQRLKLVYSAIDSTDQEELYPAPYDTETCDSTSNTDCDHPSRKCNIGCNCNIETEDGYIYDMGMLSDYIFTITQQSFIWPTEYQYNVTFCRNNIVYDRNRCNVPSSATQYETANYPTKNPRCFNIGYWTHNDYNTNMKGTSNEHGFSVRLIGDDCTCNWEKKYVVNYFFKCDAHTTLAIHNVTEDPICSHNIIFKTKFACKSFQDSINLASINYICNDSTKCNTAEQEFSRQLIQRLIPRYQLQRYKYSYDLVQHAINYIKPKSKDVEKSHRVIRFPSDKIDEIIDELIEDVAHDLNVSDLEVDRFPDLTYQIKRQAKYAKMGAVGVNVYEYSKVRINYEWGGTSKIVVGGIAFQKVENDIIFGISLYEEWWTEEDYVKINQQADIWNDREIEKYAFYLLYLNVKDRLGYN